MRKLDLMLLLVLVLVISACKKNREEKNEPAIETRQYLGSATTQAQIVDRFGKTYQRHYKKEILITISPPIEAEVVRTVENNPFNLDIGPSSPLRVNDEGQFNILSASVHYSGSATQEEFEQYWELQTNGTSISGELVSSANLDDLSANHINLVRDIGGLFFPSRYIMSRGTFFTGTMTEEEISIRIEGNSTEGDHPFVSDIVANRVEQ